MSSSQIGFEGFDEAVPTDRLFFALLPDEESIQRIAALTTRLRAEHGLKGRALDAQRLHITLVHVGDFAGFPQQRVADAMRAAASLAAAPIDVRLDRVASFSGKRGKKPLVMLGGEALAPVEAFQRVLHESLVKAGAVRGKAAEYLPHLTLMYDEVELPEQAIDPIAWTAGEFVLVNSLIGQGRHDRLGRWELKPPLPFALSRD